MAVSKSNLKFLSCVVGIFGFYFLFGVLQERITRVNYGDEKFTYIFALIFVQCIFNLLYAVLVSRFFFSRASKSSEVDSTPQTYFMAAALTYLCAMLASNKALAWVNYPTQVIGKSCKPIPVMILGVLLGGKSYPLRKYFFILLVVIGISLFMYKDSGAAKGKSEDASAFSLGIGELLLIFSLICDGLTGAIQERLKSNFRTSSTNMMTYMNLWSVVYSGALILYTGELGGFISFVGRHPDFLPQLLSFCLASALGQLFIYICVADFGPLPCSIITTTRKFFTVLGSVLFFGNALIGRQWLGTAFVFVGLILDGIFGKSTKSGLPKAA
uniref:Solute carrier family 35 member B1 n=1 Tax=Caligus rogercresseyi TaxID=217165 RepID=C1BRT5_CALRO|nr:Solute carrier family 35 member B1 [Caligus rogercresseyi]|eukprot:TRINITY_DN1314_c0_g2_i1.p1 TRINITY_DN1314_c0_g2~~TRINITY_DN1314_c0_g2_i1.p1  ORF type:complete len:328 (+),score=81.76 TRINITY_DN1314_c0_g2_i1:177-1160(+)